MIGGFPHRPDTSFFHRAVKRLQEKSDFPINSSVFTLGGFPITRIPKHVRSKGLAGQPDIVVLQFGTSDLIVPLRKLHKQSKEQSARSVTVVDRVKWQVNGFLGEVLRRNSVTPPDVYRKTLLDVASTLREHDVIPVILSPFVFGGSRSDRLARVNSNLLKKEIEALPDALYVDAYSALASHPRNRMLLGDGSHLSLEGHKVVADVLFPVLQFAVYRTKAMAEVFA